MTRKTISKKIRFEVFKRDSFTCQYCGASAPDVVLQVDHIDPVSNGGEHSVMNFITSCHSCNAGKSNRLLSDDSVVKRQKLQLDDLNERREQIEMMLQWREALQDMDTTQVEAIQVAWKSAATGWSLNETGLRTARQLLKKYGLTSILDAIDVVAGQYITLEESGSATSESVGLAWQKLSGVLRIKAMPEDRQRLYYCRGIVRSRISYCNEQVCLSELERALESGVPIDEIQGMCKQVTSWTNFKFSIDQIITDFED